MARTLFGRGTLAAALLGGGGVFVALAAWDWTGTPQQARFVRLGAVWILFGVAHVATAERGRGWPTPRSSLLGLGIALLLIGFVLSGAFLVWFGASGLLLVAMALLGGR